MSTPLIDISRTTMRRSALSLALLFSANTLAANPRAASLPEGLSASEWQLIHAALQLSPLGSDDPIAQRAYLKASNTDANDLFGISIAVSGDTVVVGARDEASSAISIGGNQANNAVSGAGAVYVFVRSGSGSGWLQQAYLKASNTGAGDGFGSAVALSGDTLIVSAPTEDSSASGVGGNQADNNAADAGAAYVFVRSAGTWTQQAYLKASNTDSGDLFGWSVAVAGNTAIVGAYLESSSATGINGSQNDNSLEDAGAAYVFVRSGSNWSQQAYLKASNTGVSDRFGIAVAIDGDTAVIGAEGERSNATGVNGAQSNNAATDAGAAYVFVRNGGTWTQQAYVKASNTDRSDRFGRALALSGNTLLVGATGEDSAAAGVGGNQSDNTASGAGAAYVFVRSGSNWAQQAYLKASNTTANYEFGAALALDGNSILIGSPFEDSSATGVNFPQGAGLAPGAGAAYAFARSGITWTQQSYIKASNTNANDAFGTALGLSGDTVVIGAPGEASNATGVNGNQGNNAATFSGAAYVFAPRGVIFDDGFEGN